MVADKSGGHLPHDHLTRIPAHFQNNNRGARSTGRPCLTANRRDKLADSCSCTLSAPHRSLPALLFPISISGLIFRLAPPRRKRCYQFRKCVWTTGFTAARPFWLSWLIQNKDLLHTSGRTAELSSPKCIRRRIKSSGSIHPNWPVCSCQWWTTGRAQFPRLVANSWVS